MIPNNVMQMVQRLNPNMADLQKVNTPDELAQYLLNTGKVNQMQVNQAKQMSTNPNVMQMLRQRFGI